MKIVLLEQGTQAWLDWRGEGVGASDAPCVMGKSPYHTRRQLWEFKTGQKKPKDISEFAKKKGGEIEAQVRARFSLHEGLDFQPATAEHEQYPFIKASFDGLDIKTGRIIEIKFVGKARFDLEEIPDHHKIQMQQQMLVSGAEFVDYLYSTDGTAYKQERCYADKKAQAELLEALIEFQKHVEEKSDPGLEPSDVHPIRDKSMLKRLAVWKKAQLAAEKAKAKADSLKPKPLEFAFEKMAAEKLCIQITKTPVKGRIDYSIVPELSGVNLEQYREEPSVKFEMKILDKPKKKTGKTE